MHKLLNIYHKIGDTVIILDCRNPSDSEKHIKGKVNILMNPTFLFEVQCDLYNLLSYLCVLSLNLIFFIIFILHYVSWKFYTQIELEYRHSSGLYQRCYQVQKKMRHLFLRFEFSSLCQIISSRFWYIYLNFYSLLHIKLFQLHSIILCI